MNQRLTISLFGLLGCMLLAEVSAAQDQANFLDKAIKIANPRMVKVYGAGAGRVEGFASGILVSKDGRIVTSQGVFLDGKQIKIGLADGSTHQAVILKRDRKSQLSLLKIEADTPDFFELSDQPIGKKGDWVVALTNAFKVAEKVEPLSATLGVISLRTTMEARLTKRDVAYQGELVLIDAITSNPGASGGAVLTMDGKLVGTVGKIINSSETNTRLNYAVPVAALKTFVDSKTSPVTNAETAVVSETEKADFGFVLFKFGGRGNPAYIDRVLRGSPAAAAKLKSDDMIVAIAGQQIGSIRDYETAMETVRPNEEVLLMVKRGTEILRIRVTPRVKDK
jgi:serine protease Do